VTELNDLVGISKLAITIKAGAEELDPESQMYLRSYIDRSPAGSDSGRIQEIEARLEMIQIDFRYNLGDDGSCVWLTEAELKGVPREVIDSLSKGTGVEEGKFFVGYTSSSFSKVLSRAVDPAIRQRIYAGGVNKVSKGPGVLTVPSNDLRSPLSQTSNSEQNIKNARSLKKLSSCAMRKRTFLDIRTRHAWKWKAI
jgi:hypothetical protein